MSWGSIRWRENLRQKQSSRGSDLEGLKQEPGHDLEEMLSDAGNSEQGRQHGAAPQVQGCTHCTPLIL